MSDDRSPLPSESAAQSTFNALRRTAADGTEFWSARDLMTNLGYERWERFHDAIARARLSVKTQGEDPARHFRDAAKVITGGRWGEQTVTDVLMSRHGAYILAMSADVRKQQIADAQAYFAIRTREAETSIPQQRALSEREQALVLAQQLLSEAQRADAQTVRADAAEHKVAELAPAAHSWTTLAQSNRDYSVKDAAQILANDPSIEMGRDRLYELLGELGWIYRTGEKMRWHAYQREIERGRLRTRPRTYQHPDTGCRVDGSPEIRVTVKALQWLHAHLGGTADIQYPAEQLMLTGGSE